MPSPIDRLRGTCRRWFGDEHDLDVFDVVVATAAAEQLCGDPLWLLVVGGPGVSKTETVQALSGAGALITSTLSSEAALLSGTSRKERAKDATGGLLRRLGTHGILVIKDVTSILAMHRDTRGSLLAALREVYDGFWERNIGTDGGRSMAWQGRIAIVGAVTTAWDRAHDVIASMGDRFVVIRMDSQSEPARTAAGQHTIANTGTEAAMRDELAAAVEAVLASVDRTHPIAITKQESDLLLAAADLVTRCRTGVDYDYAGNVVDAHALEMPTRFLRQLCQLVRGACAVGIDRDKALHLALRCATDSMPPLRLAILQDVAAHPESKTGDVRQRLNKPRMTIDRQLQALHMLGVLACDEVSYGDAGKSTWFYSLADGIKPSVLTCPDLSPPIHSDKRREGERGYLPTDISGQLGERPH